MLKKAHLWVGIIGMILFLLSGQYFFLVLGGLQGLDDTPRLLLRTSHVYFFFASFTNILFGIYYVEPSKTGWHTICNQSLILLSPLLIGYGFLCESLQNTGIDRNIGSIGVILVFVWLLNICIGKSYHLVKNIKSSKKDAVSRTSS